MEKSQTGGKLLKYHSEEIQIFKPHSEFFEQSSENIWQKVCECVKKVSAGVSNKEIVGIGFDATCSLVLFDKAGQPLTVNPTKQNEQNIIMWMDHRASLEADYINSLEHDILKYVGGKVSLEMEVPKLLWLKKNLPETFQKIHRAFDLPDFLTWRATGVDSRSICSLTCKWNYDAVNGKWPEDYFKMIGLEELMEEDASKIGSRIFYPGDKIGGLSATAANQMGLLKGTAVACSMIDAHAGALGLIGSKTENGVQDITSKLILIAGTSTCHMSITGDCLFSPGIWGPYKHALMPDYYLAEGGQSATGILIDRLLKNHPDYEKILSELEGDESVYDRLYNEIIKLAAAQKLISFHELTKDFHVYPDFHGNRSPLGDSKLKGSISGLAMQDSIYVLYLATIQSLAYQTRHIIESMYMAGRSRFESILICGGLSKNKLFVQTHADVCDIPVCISYETESVLLGAAMLGATASELYNNLETAVTELSNNSYKLLPYSESKAFHSRKFEVFMKMLEDQQSYSKIMNKEIIINE